MSDLRIDKAAKYASAQEKRIVDLEKQVDLLRDAVKLCMEEFRSAKEKVDGVMASARMLMAANDDLRGLVGRTEALTELKLRTRTS